MYLKSDKPEVSDIQVTKHNPYLSAMLRLVGRQTPPERVQLQLPTGSTPMPLSRIGLFKHGSQVVPSKLGLDPRSQRIHLIFFSNRPL